MKVKTKVTVNPKLKKLPKRFSLSAKEREELEGIIDAAASAEIDKNFETQGSESGARWPDLTPKYKRWKSRAGLHTAVLMATGGMRVALTKPGAPGHTATNRKKNNNVFIFSVGARGKEGRKAKWHAEGAGNLPVRNAVKLSKKQRDRIRGKVRTYMRKRTKKALKIGSI